MEYWTKNPDIIQITNSIENASVWSISEQTFGAVFWQSGTITTADFTLMVDKPCIVMLKKINNEFVIYAAEPTGKHKRINLTLKMSEAVKYAASLPSGNMAGGTVKMEIKTTRLIPCILISTGCFIVVVIIVFIFRYKRKKEMNNA